MGDQQDAALDEFWQTVDDHLIRYTSKFSPVVIERASGAYIYDRSGRAILDFTSGQMCSTLGHNHPAIVEAIQHACQDAIHLFSGMLSPAVIHLAEALCELLPPTLQKVLFLNTGSESNEAALRMAKLNTGGFEVIAFSSSWHGMTGGASASTYAAARQGYGPSMSGTMVLPTPNCYRCPIQHCQDHCDLTCLDVGFGLIDCQSVGAYAAVIAEPILSAGGMIVPPEDYFPRLKELCQERGMLLIVDEAQTAFGRVGSTFAFEQIGTVPDILTVSKTLGGGLPLAATITSDEIEADCHDKGFIFYTSHVSDPLPAAVGLAVLQILKAEKLAERAAEMGTYLKNGLLELQKHYDVIGDVRGRGLLLGVEFVTDQASRTPNHGLGNQVTHRCLELGLNINIVSGIPSMGGTLRIAPPLTITRDEIEKGLDILEQALKDCLNNPF
ncbi:MAG: aspartate aminotransferase family protein [Cyanobacteria bacterium J06639_16]